MSTPVSFAAEGGMDLATPAIKLPPGRVIAALNYEPTSSGYRRLRGFERFDGRLSPAEAGYYVIHFTAADTTFGNAAVAGVTVFDTHIGPTWSATTVTDAVVESGSYAAGDAAGYIVVAGADQDLTAITGIVAIGHASVDATIDSIVLNEAVPEVTAVVRVLITEANRIVIEDVPGTGPVRGVWFFDDHVIAIRDNGGGSASIYRSHETGWIAPAAGHKHAFTSGGTQELRSGQQISGDTSGTSATVLHVQLTSGSWAAGDAAGNIWLSTTPTTDPPNNPLMTPGEEIDIDAPASEAFNNAATLGALSAGTSLPEEAEWEFLTHNFYGATNLSRTYMANGQGPALVYDGVGFIEIETGMETDTPNHLAEHNGALFLSFPGGSVQFSTVGSPLSFSPVTGAGELAVGSDVTALVSANQSTLAIFSEKSINVLYGHDSTDYMLETLTDQAGAIAHSAQKIGDLIYLDNGGLRSITASAAFGNFNFATISMLVSKLLEDKRRDGINPATSFVVRSRTQYWLLFDDGTGIVACLEKKNPEILPINLGIVPTCSCSVELNGVERVFVGADDGYVYEMDKGTSFDGEMIEHYCRFAFNHLGAPYVEKRLNKVLLDLEADGTTTLSVALDINYGSVEGVPAQSVSVTTGGGALDDLGTNELYFASQIETTAEVYVDGTCRNVSLKVSGSTDDEEPHTITGFTYYVTALEQTP